MDWSKIAEWVALAVGLVAGVLLGIKEWREKRAEKRGLLPNPTRCEDHEARLRKAEAICVEIPARIHGLEENISEIKGDVKALIQMHLK